MSGQAPDARTQLPGAREPRDAAGPTTPDGHAACAPSLPGDDPAWQRFRTAVTEELDAFFAAPANRVPTSPGFPLLWERIREQVAGGKLIRPRLTHIAWRAFAGDHAGDSVGAAEVPDPQCVRLAASFEMLHAALLVHDDVVDRDWRRRGRPTVGELFRRDAAAAGAPEHEAEHAGESAAILAGDLLLAGALRLATTCTTHPERSRAVADVVFEAVAASAAGELDDLLLSLHRYGAEHPGVQDILDMERLKTATYSFEAPLRAGSLLAGASVAHAERLAQAGALLGVGYQVVDDLLGTFGDPAVTGKSVEADLSSGKATVLTAHGMGVPDARRALEDLAAGATTVGAAREALTSSGAREAAVELATDLVDRARAILDGLPLPTPQREQLNELCHHVLNRHS
ncbi:polyprenyl synthetase family protein [Kocuria sp.]|uniref:polyprenyl synthetase family protein n=1 Tax=Kocuria sp. TaxID=1871328 RepID=UPI0026DBFE87|nr:polyprenyl synthetase family protein [Kocuria sp.]MDO4920135.1 polyprenyl synthetase family protein [Kocuria sp.]